MTPEQEQKLNYVFETLKNMEAAYSIPLEIRSAFKAALIESSSITVSSKSASSENTSARNSADTGSVAVLGVPDGFVQVSVADIIYYIPYYV
jgi:hypothetical protein